MNGDKRKLLKICDNNQIIIYDDNDNIWNIYTPSPYSHIEFQLSEVTMARGVSETYGRSGHRMGAVESLMNLFTDRDTCIAKIFKNGKHTFYCIQFDDQRKTYCVLPASSCQLPTSIQRRFYAACTSTQFVFICSKGIAFVPLKPSTLKEICFLSLQLNFCKSNSDGILSGGISEQQIKDLCFCKYQHSLV
ncbi:unnamed protein product [Anisakis simplex]|uniref:Uncharacterized protein n=1 Tax=Anisakis simplex TaxID=6269 RepID=A0A3P6N723_ANISI|nr:unnamed protein product [Anisakis simplex]